MLVFKKLLILSADYKKYFNNALGDKSCWHDNIMLVKNKVLKVSDQLNKRSTPRDLSAEEANLLRWLVENPTCGAATDHEISNVSVASECGCGCASIDFAVNGEPVSVASGMSVVSDYLYKSKTGSQMGCFLFLAGGKLGGIEAWSADGSETAKSLPLPEQLYAFE